VVVNDTTAPVVTAAQVFSYAENQQAGALVGTVAATDAVGVTAFRFSTSGTTTSADGYYTIATDGKLTLTAAGVAAGVANNDYETGANSFTYAVQAGDAAGNWSTAVNVTLNVTDLSESGFTATPNIAVTKTASHTSLATPAVGDTLTYTITAENTGNVTLGSVTLSDALTGGATLTAVAGQTDDAELDVGETWSWTASYTLTQADIDAGRVENVASVSGTPAGGSAITRYSGTHGTASTATSAPAAGSGVITTLTRTASIALVKTGVVKDTDGTQGTSAGDTISYAFEVKNTGNVTLTNITVSDPKLGGTLAATLAQLAPGATDTATFSADYTVTAADVFLGQVSNQATVTGYANATAHSDLSGPTFDSDSEIITFLGTIVGTVMDNALAMPGVTVQLLNASNQVVATTTSAADGSYAFLEVPVGTFSVKFTSPVSKTLLSRSAVGTNTGAMVTNIQVKSGVERTIANVDAILVDPSGVVYDAITRLPVAGVVVRLLHNGTVVPDSWLDTTAGDANNKTTGADGRYSFFLKSPAQSGLYTLQVTDPAQSYSFQSAILPPQQTAKTPALGLGVEEIVAANTAPAVGDDATYYTSFNFTFTDWADQTTLSKGVVHNHIPLDPAGFSTALTLTKTADTSALSDPAQVGQVIGYTITVHNGGDLPYDNVSLDDPLTNNETLDVVAGVTDDGQIDPGETWTYRATYAVTAADLQAAEVRNLATLSARLQAGSNATVAPSAGRDLGAVQVLESAPTGNSTFGLGNGTATVVRLSRLIEMIRDDLQTILGRDLRLTLQRQSERFASFRDHAVLQLRRGARDDGFCGETTPEPITGTARATQNGVNIDYHLNHEVFDCQRLRWVIDQVDLVATKNRDLGQQGLIQATRRWEHQRSDTTMTGYFLGGYGSKTQVSNLALGDIRGLGLNAGLYGAGRLQDSLIYDYYVAASLGQHRFDLDFARQARIRAVGDYTYLGLFAGAGLEGETEISDLFLRPNLRIDAHGAPKASADVTATSGLSREIGTVDVLALRGARLSAGIEVENNLALAHDGQGLWDHLDGTLTVGFGLFCDLAPNTRGQCGLHNAVEWQRLNPEKGTNTAWQLTYDSAKRHDMLHLSWRHEQAFVKIDGSRWVALRIDPQGGVAMQAQAEVKF